METLKINGEMNIAQIKIIEITHRAHERIGISNIGLYTYKYRWYVTVKDNRKESYGTQSYYKGNWINSRVAFIGTKPEVKKWLKYNDLIYKW